MCNCLAILQHSCCDVSTLYDMIYTVLRLPRCQCRITTSVQPTQHVANSGPVWSCVEALRRLPVESTPPERGQVTSVSASQQLVRRTGHYDLVTTSTPSRSRPCHLDKAMTTQSRDVDIATEVTTAATVLNNTAAETLSPRLLDLRVLSRVMGAVALLPRIATMKW